VVAVMAGLTDPGVVSLKWPIGHRVAISNEMWPPLFEKLREIPYRAMLVNRERCSW
jgi:hypothetical protein